MTREERRNKNRIFRPRARIARRSAAAVSEKDVALQTVAGKVEHPRNDSSSRR